MSSTGPPGPGTLLAVAHPLRFAVCTPPTTQLATHAAVCEPQPAAHCAVPELPAINPDPVALAQLSAIDSGPVALAQLPTTDAGPVAFAHATVRRVYA